MRASRCCGTLAVAADYVAEAKKAAPGANVLYGNNYPWPNYFAHIIWPQWRSQDVVMLDLQYVCGFEKTLGNNEEMIDILEAAESIGKHFGKSIWGREVYYQPRYPAEIAALHGRIEMRKLRRIPGETALYWSTETSADTRRRATATPSS